MNTKTTTQHFKTLLNDDDLTTEEVLTLMYPNYLTMRQNGRVIKLWQIVVKPELARFLLKKNENNRRLNDSNLNLLKTEVIAGRWREISDPIQITSEDKLNNGQHRLTVISELNVPLPLRIETNIDSTTFTVIDTGRKRNATDTLWIKHIENATVTATTIRFIHMMDNKFSSSTKVSNQNMVEFINENPSLVDSVKFGVSNYKKGNKVVTASLLSTFHYLLKDNYKVESEKFLLKLALGNNIELNCPAGALRNKFIGIKNDKIRSIKGEVLLQYMIVAWNKYISGEKTKSIKLPNEIPSLIM